MRIALADDRLDEVANIIPALVEAGYSVDTFGNGEELMAALRRDTFDLLLLDWNMPRTDGLDVLIWVRDNFQPAPPVIILTNRDTKSDIIMALETGAADYIRKPEDPEIVRARVAAALRRTWDKAATPSSQFGSFIFHDATESVSFDGETIELRHKEFMLARLLFENLNRPLSRGYIMQRIWQSSPDIESRTLDMHISRLRTKLHLRPERGMSLRTIFGFGYRLDSVLPSGE